MLKTYIRRGKLFSKYVDQLSVPILNLIFSQIYVKIIHTKSIDAIEVNFVPMVNGEDFNVFHLQSLTKGLIADHAKVFYNLLERHL